MKLRFGFLGSTKNTGIRLAALATFLFIAEAQAQIRMPDEPPGNGNCNNVGEIAVICPDGLASEVTCTSVNCSGASSVSTAKSKVKWCTVWGCTGNPLKSTWKRLCMYGNNRKAVCKTRTETCPEECELPISIISVAAVESHPFNNCKDENLNPNAKAAVAAGQLALEKETADAEFTNLMNEWFADSKNEEAAKGCGSVTSE